MTISRTTWAEGRKLARENLSNLPTILAPLTAENVAGLRLRVAGMLVDAELCQMKAGGWSCGSYEGHQHSAARGVARAIHIRLVLARALRDLRARAKAVA